MKTHCAVSSGMRWGPRLDPACGTISWLMKFDNSKPTCKRCAAHVARIRAAAKRNKRGAA